MQKWAASFYRSKAWRSCRDCYYLSQHGICQRCNGAGEIVHHINGDKADNRIENLMVVNFAEHMQIHNVLRRTGGDAVCHMD